MSKVSFSESIRIFKEGLDKEIFVYWKSFVEKWWEVFWGPTVAGIAFGIYTLWHAPALPFFLLYVLLVVFLTGYYLWRPNYLCLQSSVVVANLTPYRWNGPTGDSGVFYDFEVCNKNEGKTVRNVCVQLVRVEPEIPGLNWLPVILRQHHDHSFQASKNFDLNPGESKKISFISATKGNDYFDVQHIVPSVNMRLYGEDTGRLLKVVATGEDVPAISKTFKAYIDSEGLHCEILGEDGST